MTAAARRSIIFEAAKNRKETERTLLYIIDTANLDDIKRCMEYFPVAGITTNPTIISKEHTGFPDLIKAIRALIGDEKMLHIQTTGTDAQTIVKEAVLLRDFVGGDFYAKIPISPEGLKATMQLKKMGIKVTETAIFTQQQAMIAAQAGADFVAPYINRLDSIVSDGVHVVSEIVKMFNVHNIKSRVLAASFKNVEQIHKIALAGGHAVTISPELFNTLTYHPLTDRAIESFNADWQSVYGDKGVLDVFER